MVELQKMMATMRAMDQKPDEFVASMKSVTGAAKVGAIANVLAALVEQRAPVRSGDGHVGPDDGCMMQHVIPAGRNDGHDGPLPDEWCPSIVNCPMMQQLQKEAAESAK